jgi:BirA family transcriptional regulator, biotin operon repressor / biotin---[acetyl-CoA-carboxylase] ligase
VRQLPRQDWFGLAAFEPGPGRAREGAPFYLLETVDSTSDFLLGRGEGGLGRLCAWDGWGWQAPRQQRLAPPAAPAPGAVAVARRQTRGRGRMGRAWTSTGGLMMSWLVSPAPPRGATGLAVWTGLIAAIVLREEFGLAVDLKWPNDLLIGPRKLGGILFDAARTAHGPLLVAGLGLNLGVTVAELPADLRGRATSLHIAKARVPQPAVVAGALLARFDAELASFRADGWSPYLRRFVACDRLRGRRITLETAQGAVTGRAAGIDETGALLLRRPDGRIARLLAGDVHVVDLADPAPARRTHGPRARD